MTAPTSTLARGIGEPLPPIVLPDLEGNPLDLSTLTGKRRLLFMWASW